MSAASARRRKMESGGVLYLAAEVVSEGGAPATGGEGQLGDGVAEEHQPRPHLVSPTLSSSLRHGSRIGRWTGLATSESEMRSRRLHDHLTSAVQ
jgi:hypothetical protein